LTGHEALLERIAGAEHVTLDIGPGRDPLLGAFNLSFDDSHLYVGLNIDPAQHNWLSLAINSCDGAVAVLAHRNIYGRMVQTPLPSASIDTVHVSNVMGEPDEPGIMLDFHDKNHLYHGHSNETAKLATLSEVKRLLRADGELIIIENYTPYGENSPAGLRKPRYEKLVGILERKGFGIVDAVGDPVGFIRAAREARDDLPYEYAHMSSYLIRAKKL